MVTINIIIRITEREIFFLKLAKKLVPNTPETERKYMDDEFEEMGVGVSF